MILAVVYCYLDTGWQISQFEKLFWGVLRPILDQNVC